MKRILITFLTGILSVTSLAYPGRGHMDHGDHQNDVISFGNFIDVNGDGSPDRCRRVSQGIACQLGGGFSQLEMWTYNFSDAQDWNKPYYGQTIRFADVNGDGLTDVCGRAASGILCSLSDGYQFREWTNWNSYFSNGNGFANAQFYQSIQLNDVNYDGMADICANSPRGYICMHSTGYSFR